MITASPSYKEMSNMTYNLELRTTPFHVACRVFLYYMFASLKNVLLNTVKTNAATLHSNFETILWSLSKSLHRPFQ